MRLVVESIPRNIKHYSHPEFEGRQEAVLAFIKAGLLCLEDDLIERQISVRFYRNTLTQIVEFIVANGLQDSPLLPYKRIKNKLERILELKNKKEEEANDVVSRPKEGKRLENRIPDNGSIKAPRTTGYIRFT